MIYVWWLVIFMCCVKMVISVLWYCFLRVCLNRSVVFFIRSGVFCWFMLIICSGLVSWSGFGWY